MQVHIVGRKALRILGKEVGNAHLKWAFSEAAVLFLRKNPGGQKLFGKLARKHGKGKAESEPFFRDSGFNRMSLDVLVKGTESASILSELASLC